MESEEHKDKLVSRRDALRRVATIGAVAWSAPVLSSFRAPAFAGSASPCTPDDACCQCYDSSGLASQCSTDTVPTTSPADCTNFCGTQGNDRGTLFLNKCSCTQRGVCV